MAISTDLTIDGGVVLSDAYLKVANPRIVERVEEKSKTFTVHFHCVAYASAEARTEACEALRPTALQALCAAYDPSVDGNPYATCYAHLKGLYPEAEDV